MCVKWSREYWGGMVWGFPISCLCTYLVEKLIQILRPNIVSDYAVSMWDLLLRRHPLWLRYSRYFLYIYIYTHTHINLYYRSSCLLLRLYLQFCLWISFIYVLFMELPAWNCQCNERRFLYIYFIYIIYIYVYLYFLLVCFALLFRENRNCTARFRLAFLFL